MIGLGIAAVVAVGIGAAVVLSGDDDTVAGPPAGVTLDDLEPVLLTEGDVGNGFTLDTSGDDSDDPMDSESIGASDECRAAIESFEVSDAAREEIGVDFADDVGGTVQQSVSLAGEGIPTVAEARQAIDQCDSMTFEDEGATGEFRFDTSDVDGLGDDAVGVTVGVDMQTQGYSIEFDMYGVLWERGGVNSSVFGFGGFDEASFEGLSIDEAWVRDLATTADDRIADVLAG